MTMLSTEYPAYFESYINLAMTERPLAEELKVNFDQEIAFLKSIDESKKDYAYDEGKWTIGQILQHIIDVELVMAHRAFRVSRKDETGLPGFDHNAYVEVADISHKSLADLCAELIMVRNVTNMHFSNLKEEALGTIGTVSNNAMSVRALGYIIIGHMKHHNKILKERYL